ncbi:MAG: Tim44/TimA family putative adaptor protein [Alphaproteobacteria bacterium]
MTAELMVYALIAAALVFWLRNILGTRSEDDPQISGARMELDSSGKIVTLGAADTTMQSDRKTAIEELFEKEKGNMAIENSAARDALINIAKIDLDFDIHQFLQATQDAFVYVVEAFAEGDRDTLADLLSPQVYEAFDKAITQRQETGEVMHAEIQSIQKSAVVEARLENKGAFITVRFVAAEVTYIKDSDGNIIQGNPDKATQMRDIWIFFRDLGSRDPRWTVVETREDEINDNDTLPNAH